LGIKPNFKKLATLLEAKNEPEIESSGAIATWSLPECA
jgi:hypothetical protein